MVIACLTNDSDKKAIGSDNGTYNTSNCDSKKGKDPFHIQETLARLINAMASVKIGRDYICKYAPFS